MIVPPSGQHGGDGASLAAALGIAPSAVIDLSASLNPLAPEITRIVNHHLGSLRRYPDPTRASHALADEIGVDPDELLLTNGGSEAIALCCDELMRRHHAASIRPHDFSLYARHLPTIRTGAPRVRSNPGNPTGQLHDPSSGTDDDGVPVGIWDEAFWPLATGTWTSGAHLNGSMIVGSLTKIFACPGLRLGYVLADPQTITTLRNRQPRWSVATLAAEALPDILATTDLEGWSRGITERRNTLLNILRQLGFETIPGVNWVLAKKEPLNGSQIRNALAPQRILVRDCASFDLPQYVRIALPTDSDLDLVIEAIVKLSHEATTGTHTNR